MSGPDTLNLALSADERGHGPQATLVASILRRASVPVHVRCWCRGFLPSSFETGRLKVEFFAAEGEVRGQFPSHVGPAVFDRLRVIGESEDWDRCLVMDYDQVALCDLAPLFSMAMGDALLAAKMQGAGVDMAYAMRVWLKRPIPVGWEHVAPFPYFSMGPLLNLRAMREAGTWEKLLKAQAAFAADEQLALTAATDGRTMGFDKKWNLFPKNDIPESVVPEGVVHWLGWPKPWHPGAKVWRPDIWHSERATWEHLRMGIWEKPVVIEIEPDEGKHARALLERGWKVRVVGRRVMGLPVGRERYPDIPDFPDLEIVEATAGENVALEVNGRAPEFVRVGAWADAATWLAVEPRPRHLVLQGPVPKDEVSGLAAVGYARGMMIERSDWPPGGPLPRVLALGDLPVPPAVEPGQDLILERAEGTAAVKPLVKRERPNHSGAGKRVGLVVTATGRYVIYLPALFRSIRRNFLPGHRVEAILFTDSELAENDWTRVVKIPPLPWPEPALRRYDWISTHREQFSGIDFLYSVDADMRIVGEVGPEIFSQLVATLHPGFVGKPRERFTFETRVRSRARVAPHEGTAYYAGAFQGGERERYLDAASTMARAIAADREDGITAVWHDESHWNRYLIDHPPSLVLGPSYCHYPDGRSADHEPKIQIVPKDAAAMRSPPAAATGQR